MQYDETSKCRACGVVYLATQGHNCARRAALLPGELRAGWTVGLYFALGIIAVLWALTAWRGHLELAGDGVTVAIICGWRCTRWWPHTRRARLARERAEEGAAHDV